MTDRAGLATLRLVRWCALFVLAACGASDPPAREVTREELATPLDDTIFFAGEATDSEEAGTVAGALRSGIRAARQAMR